MLTGKHLIAGDRVGNDQTFASSPAHGPSHPFAVGTPAHVNAACDAAEAAFPAYAAKSRQDRANFLNRIADEIEARGAEITEIGTQETGLPAARLEGERGRTTMQ
ncbi:MAG: aldehyde dehydrogenase family protein, partial [Tabrizicola sp.]